ncbi:CHY-type/CTCHY-type/RING-type zinc finger protein [Citrus sinensis]|nr:CHY-type/CTCHY-type/RING-type zinc finger protein [Citrus sinensis]KAH9799418.1 CHY-type/CTCHY-type/RING-type zinc finger protein [Citrus sinensis]
MSINIVVAMAGLEVHHSSHQQFEPMSTSCKADEIFSTPSYSHLADREFLVTEESTNHNGSTELLRKGFMEYGCQHYRRRCRIRAPCCNEIFDCRHCHNEAMNNINVDQKLRHDIPRHEVNQVICSLCGTEQKVSSRFSKFVLIVVYAWVNTSARVASCLMMIHPRSNIIVMDVEYAGLVDVIISSIATSVVRCCYSMLLKNSHPCVEGAMHHDCPVCCEYLFETRQDVIVLPCGHTIHKNCLKEMREHHQYACPICSKSVCDMSKVWEKYDREIAATPMPEAYLNKKVWILCNDCGKTSNVQFHVLAQKCPNCKSYNTRLTRG